MVLSEDLIFQLEIPSEVKGKAVASAYLGMNVWDISLMGHIVDDLKKHMNSLRSWCLNRCRGECLGELSVNVAAKGSIKNGVSHHFLVGFSIINHPPIVGNHPFGY